ncbi:hypothetical protein MBLNU230_g7040t1 [Neophaeotheca triangularis]
MATAIKRKRDSQDMPDMRPAPGMHQDFDTSYLQADDGTMDNHDTNMDFSLLAQHNADGSEEVDIQQHAPLQNQQTHHHGQHDQHQHQHQHHHHPHQDTSDSGNHNNNGQSATDTATAALAQYHTMTVPQPTEHSFMQSAGNQGGEDQGGSGGDGDLQRTNSYDGNFTLSEAIKDAENRVQNGADESSPPGSSSKPAVGSDEWHKVRRDNHKEVERRRRETINEGINELAKIVPGCEKNKGSILSRAVAFIQQLKENETQNIEKWTLEKLLTEQAIQELSSSCDKLKAECQRAWAEAEHWKLRAGEAGVDVDGEGVGEGDGAGKVEGLGPAGGGGGGFGTESGEVE